MLGGERQTLKITVLTILHRYIPILSTFWAALRSIGFPEEQSSVVLHESLCHRPVDWLVPILRKTCEHPAMFISADAASPELRVASSHLSRILHIKLKRSDHERAVHCKRYQARRNNTELRSLHPNPMILSVEETAISKFARPCFKNGT